MIVYGASHSSPLTGTEAIPLVIGAFPELHKMSTLGKKQLHNVHYMYVAM